MSIEILSRDILQKAQSEKDLIESDFSREITILQENSKKNIESFKEKLKGKYDEDILNQKEKILGNYKRESKKEILEIKTRLIEEVYEKTYEDLCSLKGEDKSKIFSHIINNVKKSKFNFEKVICNKKDAKIIKELLTTDTKIIQDENIEGLIFVTNSDKEILDMTFKTLLKDAFEKTESKIQKTLFNI